MKTMLNNAWGALGGTRVVSTATALSLRSTIWCAGLVLSLVVFAAPRTAGASPAYFPLDNTAYVIQGGGAGTSSYLTEISFSADPWTFTTLSVTWPVRINNLGFRVEGTGGLLYALEWDGSSGATPSLITIDAAGTKTRLTTTGATLLGNMNSGDISSDGNSMFLTNSGGAGSGAINDLYVVDLTTLVVTQINITGFTGNVNDFAYNPIDDYLYGGNHANGAITRLNPTNGERTDFSVNLLPYLGGGFRYGGAWFGPDGTLYLYENTEGKIYPVTGVTGTPTLGAFLQGSASTDVDAAAYSGQPVPEPATMWLLLLGAGLIGLARIGKKVQQRIVVGFSEPPRGLTAMKKSAAAALLLLLAVAGTASADIITPSLSDFVVFGGEYTRIGGHTVITGNIGSNGDLLVQGGPLTGYPAQIYGSVYVGGNLDGTGSFTFGELSAPIQVVANGDAFVQGGTTIYGTLDASTATINGTVTGTVTLAPSNDTFGQVGMSAMPLTGFTLATTQPVLSCSGTGCTTLTLAPNTSTTAFADVLLGQNKSLYLESGDYYLNSLTASGDLTLYIDLSSGAPININVGQLAGDTCTGDRCDVNIGQNATLWVKIPGSDSYVRLDTVPEYAGLIYWNILGQFDVGGGAHGTAPYAYTAIFGGTVYSSKLDGSGTSAGILLGQAVDFYGALHSLGDVYLLDHSRITFVEAFDVPEPAALLLMGTGLIALAWRWRSKSASLRNSQRRATIPATTCPARR